MHISSYHRLIGVLRMYSDVFPLVVKAGLKPAYNFSVKNSISTFLVYS